MRAGECVRADALGRVLLCERGRGHLFRHFFRMVRVHSCAHAPELA
jgi:hypothetical protein